MLSSQVGFRLIQPSIKGGDSGAGVLVEIPIAGLQGQNFLRPSRFLAPQLTSLLLSGRTVGLFGGIVGDH